MGRLKDLLTKWKFSNPNNGDSAVPADVRRNAPGEYQGRPARGSDAAASGPPNPPEPAHRVTEKSPKLIVMPQGPETFAGRYPGYKPAQAMSAFRTVPDLHRLSYDELSDSCWGIACDGHEVVLGCFVEPDGTPVIVVTYLAEPEHSESGALLLALEAFALRKSAHSTEKIVAEDWISTAVSSGRLRQLRPSEVG